jgi:predicted DNA-binding protein with PD1-like motif
MRHRLLVKSGGRRTFAVTLDMGEEVIGALTALAAELQLASGSITAVGGFERASLGYFDYQTRVFRQNEIDEQVELLSLVGNLAEAEDGTPKIHAHVVLGRFDATTRGGHLVAAKVRPTFEAIIEETPEHLKRKHDASTGLVLLQP